MRSIVFIGFMGVGKTTIGELVAKKLLRDFVDIDKEIEKDFHLSIPEIFQTFGEPAFRDKERELIFSVCKRPLQVISLGGGAFLQSAVRQFCLAHCIVFYLDMTWDSWKERINVIVDNRPVLQGRTMEDIEKVFHERKAIYSLHNSKFDIGDWDAEGMAEYIVDTIKLSWDLYD